jgi:hypothetical protein
MMGTLWTIATELDAQLVTNTQSARSSRVPGLDSAAGADRPRGPCARRSREFSDEDEPEGGHHEASPVSHETEGCGCRAEEASPC